MLLVLDGVALLAVLRLLGGAAMCRKRIDETNKRIDALGAVLNRMIDKTSMRIDAMGVELNKRINGAYGVLGDL